jgi:hypothetical protein
LFYVLSSLLKAETPIYYFIFTKKCIIRKFLRKWRLTTGTIISSRVVITNHQGVVVTNNQAVGAINSQAVVDINNQAVVDINRQPPVADITSLEVVDINRQEVADTSRQEVVDTNSPEVVGISPLRVVPPISHRIRHRLRQVRLWHNIQLLRATPKVDLTTQAGGTTATNNRKTSIKVSRHLQASTTSLQGSPVTEAKEEIKEGHGISLRMAIIQQVNNNQNKERGPTRRVRSISGITTSPPSVPPQVDLPHRTLSHPTHHSLSPLLFLLRTSKVVNHNQLGMEGASL